MQMRLRTARLVVAALLLGGCSAKPAAEVSESELAAVRQAHASAQVGDSKQQVLDSFKAGNAVKLGNSVVEGASIEEWKVEAFHDENERKNLFITFLYFCNDRFVDSSDTRIDFRSNPELAKQWRSQTN